MMRLAEAQDLLDGAAAALKGERVKVGDSLGRWLAADAEAEWDLPRASVSAMDGWAVDHEDLEGATDQEPVLLGPGESTHAGDERGTLPERGCAWVATGGAVPRGATAVVPREDAETEDGSVRFMRPVARGSCIRVEGEDVHAGEAVARAGERVTHWTLQPLITAGVEKVTVSKRPRVAVVASGDELFLPGAKPRSEMALPASNVSAIAARASAEGCEVVGVRLVPDDEGALTEAVSTARDEADLVVTIGGASVGRRDHALAAFEGAEAKVLVNGISIKPGKPTILARWTEGTLGLGLPGNPVSASVVFEIVGVQALRRLVGAHWYRMAPLRAALAAPLRWKGGREGFLPARVASRAPLSVEPVQGLGSHRVAGLAYTDCLLRLPPEELALQEGDEVEALTWT